MKGKAGSTTYAAIADSIITTTKEKTDKEISHDTTNALNTLSEIFDKKKIEEKQEYVNILSQVGYRLIGDIAGHKENELYKKTEKPEKAGKENNSILAEKYEKEVTMAGYHFGDEDYVILNGSIGIGLGLSGGLIMDRMDNIYFVRGGGIVSSLGGTVATGKFSVDTSDWKSKEFKNALTGSGANFSLSLYGSANINIGERYGSREIGIANGASVSITYTDEKYICNVNDL